MSPALQADSLPRSHLGSPFSDYFSPKECSTASACSRQSLSPHLASKFLKRIVQLTVSMGLCSAFPANALVIRLSPQCTSEVVLLEIDGRSSYHMQCPLFNTDVTRPLLPIEAVSSLGFPAHPLSGSDLFDSFPRAPRCCLSRLPSSAHFPSLALPPWGARLLRLHCSLSLCG